MSKTLEIVCKRGLNRIECKFKKQDPYLCCAECSFAAFVERKKQQQTSSDYTKTDINKDEQ